MEQHDHGESGYTEAQVRALIAKLTREEKERLIILLQSLKENTEAAQE